MPTKRHSFPGSSRSALLASLVLSSACLTAPEADGLLIFANYVDGGGETWTAERRAVVDFAIAEWTSWLDAPAGALPFLVNIELDTLGPNALGRYLPAGNPPVGTDLLPWSSTFSKTITFNTELFTPRGSNFPDNITSWWDPSPGDNAGPNAAQWDLLTVARHELAHMLGFAANNFREDFLTANESDYWTRHITGSTFDAGGLNVPMEPADFSHTDPSASNNLMDVAIPNGTRYEITETDARMLALAYGYTLDMDSMIPGDANGDGAVDLLDLDILGQNWESSGTVFSDGDFNADGTVNLLDLDILGQNWGTGSALDGATFGQALAASGLPVPEPSSICAVGAATTLLLRRRRSSRSI